MTSVLRDSQAQPTKAATERRGGVWLVPSGPADEGLGELGALIPPRQYGAGVAIYRLHAPADGFFLVLAGKVKLSVPGTARGERLLAVCGPGDLFGTSRCAGAGEHLSEAVSLAAETWVIHITCARLSGVVREHPDIALRLTQALSTRIGTLEEQVEHARLPVQARLAHTLLSLARRLGTEVAPDIYQVPLALTQDELASLAGAGRISVAGALSAWRTMGIVTGTRGTYQVDTARLGALLELLELDELK